MNLQKTAKRKPWSHVFYKRVKYQEAVADLGGAPPPTAQNFLNFMQFSAKFGKIICWRPLLRGILDPPLGRFE